MTFKVKAVLTFAFTALVSVSSFADKAKVLRELESLYPQLNREEIQKKIDASDNAGEFFRAFSAYYYFTLKTSPYLVGNLIKLAPEAGWCVGDAHFGNFGAVLDRRGKSQLTINDVDDAGPCPLMTDALRYMTSLILDGHNFNWPLLMMAYKQGLEGAPSMISRETKNLLMSSEQLGLGVDPDDLESPQKLKREKNSRETTSAEKDFISKSVKGAYSSAWELLDSFAYAKVGGGSHGQLRFRALIKNGSEKQHIQFKQMVQPGIYPLAVGPIPATAARVRTALLNEQGEGYSPFYSVQNLASNLPMLMQPLRYGDLKFKPKDYSASQIQNIILDETRQLGRLHSKTASQKYPQAVGETADTEWNIASRNLAKYFVEIYNTVK